MYLLRFKFVTYLPVLRKLSIQNVYEGLSLLVKSNLQMESESVISSGYTFTYLLCFTYMWKRNK